jgi:HlyD family secretion protein
MSVRKFALLLVLAVLVAAISGAWLWQRKNRETANLTLYGNVEIRDALLVFNEQEIVAEVLAEEGDAVKAGQVLARLRSAQLAAQLAEAQARFEAQAQVVRRLENGSRSQEVKRARARVNADRARIANARLNLRRLKNTAAQGASSRQARDDARALLDVEQAQLEVDRQTLELLLEGPRQEEIAEAQAQLEANRNGVVFLRERLADTVLKSPSDGIVQSRILEPGEMAGPARPAFILAMTDPKWIRAYVPEENLGRVREGLAAQVSSDSWPGQAFAGQVGFISPVAEFTPQPVETTELRTKLVYEVRVVVQDPDNRLRLGMPVTVRFGDGAAAPCKP